MLFWMNGLTDGLIHQCMDKKGDHASSQDKKNHATSLDKKKSRNLLGKKNHTTSQNNERPQKTLHPMAQTDTHTIRHGNSMTELAKWGPFSEKMLSDQIFHWEISEEL